MSLNTGAAPQLGGSNNAKKSTTPATSLAPTSLPSILPSSINLKAPATTVVATPSGLTLGSAPVVSSAAPATTSALGAMLGGGLGGMGAAPKVTPTTSASSTVPADRMTFSQLEDCINKWTADLQEEEKTFLMQATQINAWDKVINDNERRLAALNTSVKQVEEQQTRINYDLDFILTQLRDLELCLAPLEKDGDSYLTMKSEPQRKQLYLTATQIDSQMKRISEDLKEVIEQTNEASRNLDSSDPVLQVGRVLNAQMDWLHIVGENSSRIQESLDHITKMHSRLKKDSELPSHLELM